ncbi:NB-ARC domain-containing protein [Nocardia bovistercoris]|uniref:Winged helix-turn-helix domain-containing protein n=1 Tax=Nocardia bovistercoris TaxID=2785916 RepID=A0A931IB40_9NOCA|nr:NB-ARC domain-containing protein [Nocardia bovistercoris]MBH0776583.1 winged helix-turn-helix domain-containing protein [Nocardia bovistercoris]
MTATQILVLGPVRLLIHGKPVDLRPQQAQTLAVLTAVAPGHPVDTETLVEALWPHRNRAPESKPNLYAVISKLRERLAPGGLTIAQRHGSGYVLAPADSSPSRGEQLEIASVVDRFQFRTAVRSAGWLLRSHQVFAAADLLGATAPLWRGDPFGVGRWTPPDICAATADEMRQDLRDLLDLWGTCALLTGAADPLQWLDTESAPRAEAEHIDSIWLSRVLGALSTGHRAEATAMVERRRASRGYDPFTVGADMLIQAHEAGGAYQLRAARAPAESAAPGIEGIAALPSSSASFTVLRPDEYDVAAVRDAATKAGIRCLVVRADAENDFETWRVLSTDLVVAALRDHITSLHSDTIRDAANALLDSTEDRAGDVAERVRARARDSATVATAVAVRGPVLIVIETSTPPGAVLRGLLDRFAERLQNRPVGVVILGAFPVTRAVSATSAPATPGAGAPKSTPAARHWLAAAAITAVEGRVDPAVVAAVADLAAADADTAQAAAIRASVIENRNGAPRFVSGEHIDKAVAELATTPDLARRLHRRAFHRLSDTPGHPAATPRRLAEHAAAARNELPDETIAEALLVAARDARATGDGETALNWVDQALGLTRDEVRRFELTLVRGDVAHDRADMTAAAAAYEQAVIEAGTSVTRIATATIRSARRWSNPGRTDDQLLRRLDLAKHALQPTITRDPAHRLLWMQVNAHIAHKSSMALSPDAADHSGGIRLARSLIEMLRPDDPAEAVCDVLTECRWALYDFASPDEIRALSRRLSAAAERGESQHFRGEALIATVIDQLRVGELTHAAITHTRFREHVEAHPHGIMPWLVMTLDTMADLWSGRLDKAERRLLGDAADFLTRANGRAPLDSLRQTRLGQLFWLRREQGAMHRLADEGVGEMLADREFFPIWVAAGALASAETGRTAAAMDALRVLTTRTDGLAALPPHGWSVTVLMLIAETLATLHRGAVDTADLLELARLTDAALAPHASEVVLSGWPTVLLGPVGRARTWLALITGDNDAALRHLADSARVVGREPAQLAWHRYQHARVLLAAGDAPDGHPRRLLQQARATAEEHGFVALIAAIDLVDTADPKRPDAAEDAPEDNGRRGRPGVGRDGDKAEMLRAEFVRTLRQAIAAAERRTGNSPKRTELARRLGISTASLYAYLKGTTLPRTEVFDRMMFELGIEGRTMGRLHDLRDAVDIAKQADTAATPIPSANGGRPVSDLPRDTAVLLGREAELEAVATALRDPARGVCVVCGPGGVGKTALAIRSAYRLGPEFPDGALYFDLHGFAAKPVTTAEALTRLLHRLGVPSSAIPAHSDDRSGLLREVLRERHMLLVLDNAADTAHVLSLLPGAGACRVVVTSRSTLSGLEDAVRVRVRPLPSDTSVALLRELMAGTTGIDESELTALAHRCGGLPLALRIAASRLREDPAAPHELLGAGERADLAVFDDHERNLASVFAASVRHLTEPAASSFTMLGLHDGPDFDHETVAALTASDRHAARTALRALADAHLIEQTQVAGRYRFHDLVGEFARGLAARTVDAERRDAAILRSVDHHLGLADAVDRALTPYRHRVGMHPERTGAQRKLTYDEAMARMSAELDNMVAVLRRAHESGLDERCWQLAFALREFCFIVDALDPWLHTHRLALASTLRARVSRAEAVTRNNLGLALLVSGDIDAAEGMYRQALAIYRATGDRHGEHITVAHRAWVHEQRGDLERALRDSTAALRFIADGDSPRHHAILLRDTARLEIALHRYADAIPKLEEALHMFAMLELTVDTATAHLYTGTARLRLGDIDGARTAFTAAAAAARHAGSVYEQARANDGLGETAYAGGDHALARHHWQLALIGFTRVRRDDDRARVLRRLDGAP